MVQEERRKSNRNSLSTEHVKRTVRIFKPSALEEYTDGEILNISDGGLCLKVLQTLRKSDIIKVMFRLTKHTLSIPTLGEVRWVKHYGKENNVCTGGIRFIF